MTAAGCTPAKTAPPVDGRRDAGVLPAEPPPTEPLPVLPAGDGWRAVDLSADEGTYHQIHALHCASASECVAGTRAEGGDGMLIAFDPAQPDVGPRPLIADVTVLDGLVGDTCLVSWRFTGFSALAAGGLAAHTNVQNLLLIADDAARIGAPADWRPVATLIEDSECNPAFRVQVASAGSAVFYAKGIRATGSVDPGAAAATQLAQTAWGANTWAPGAVPPVPGRTSDLRGQHPDVCASGIALPNESFRNTEELVYASPDLSVELMLADGPGQATSLDTGDAAGVCRWDAARGLFHQVPIPPALLPENARVEDQENGGSAGPVGMRCQPAASGLTECLVYGFQDLASGWVYAFRMRIDRDGASSWTRAELPQGVAVKSLRVSHVAGSVWLLGGKSADGPLLWISTDGGWRFQDASAGLAGVVPVRADQVESLAIAGSALVVGLDEDAALAVYPGYLDAL